MAAETVISGWAGVAESQEGQTKGGAFSRSLTISEDLF